MRLYEALQLKSHKFDSARWAEHGWARWEEVVAEEFGLSSGALLRKLIGPRAEASDEVLYVGRTVYAWSHTWMSWLHE